MDRSFKMDALDGIEVSFPESVQDPKPKFRSASEALRFYIQKLELVAQQKKLTLDELRAQANQYKFGPDESFSILRLFDSIRALRALE
jgi:hypothetical protein